MSKQTLLRAILLLVMVSATGLTYAKSSGGGSGTASTSSIDWYFTSAKQIDQGLDWTCNDDFVDIRQLNKNTASTNLILRDGPDCDSSDADLLRIIVDNAYPCNYNRITATIKISGTLPMKLENIIVNGITQPFDFSSRNYSLDLSGDGLADIELRITPDLSDSLNPGTCHDVIIEYHILQAMPENAHLNFQIQFEATQYSLIMSARTIGYWKTHPNVWDGWQPSPDSIFYGKTQGELLSYFPRNSETSKKMNILEMLRAQLLAAELNVYYFDSRFDYSRYSTVNIYDTIDEAEQLLHGLPSDLGSYWDGLTKQQQKTYRLVATPLKDALDLFNNMGDGYF